MKSASIENKLLKIRNRHFLLLDLMFMAFSPFFALFIRLDGKIDISFYWKPLIAATIVLSIIKVAIFFRLGLYRRYWHSAGMDEVARLIIVSIFALIVQSNIFLIMKFFGLFGFSDLPKSLPIIDGFIIFIFISISRLSIKFFERFNERQASEKLGERVLILGAGKQGASVVEEMQRNTKLGLSPIAFIDDDPNKKNVSIRGIPVVGGRDLLKEAVKMLNIQKVIIAIPSAPGHMIRGIIDQCLSLGVHAMTLPSMSELLNEDTALRNIREVQIEDLLRRDPVETDIKTVASFIEGKKILVTGAGGSIGSELCRQIIKCHPSELILLGHGENSVFEIEQELNRRLILSGNGSTHKTVIRAIIGDIRFKDRVYNIFREHNPDIVYHAAAHKHVPMMEGNPPEAVSNNILGTKNLVDVAVDTGVKHFVYVSTDKAVNPTSVMGATKRVAEMIVLNAAQENNVHYVAVRFGNVLGSRGSVIFTFKQQIASGGPVTVTHPDITRYFMTIPEAVQLVLQASVLGEGGEIFILDMGEQIKVIDLAKDMIKLSGYDEGKDIKIIFTGLRPGEKLYEELIVPGEKYQATSHKKILIAMHGDKNYLNDFEDKLIELFSYLSVKDKNNIVSSLKLIVPEYTPLEFPEVKVQN
ncbi:MAG: polysaccharide biosynthesis protein [Ignavibacteriae bacterium]|nr:polysaccharide biosynthesis protein [Ignavibacteriota bacterium]